MKTLLVADGGGHLTQLQLLRDRLVPSIDESLWVTFNGPQSEALLRGEDVTYSHHPTTRNLPNALRNFSLARRLLREHRPDRVISTGAGSAVPFFLAARLRGIPCHYIESATRVWAPSLSGRIVERLPGVNCYTQYPHWVRPGWRHAGSVLDGFRREPDESRTAGAGRRVFVSLGTHSFAFDALVNRIRGLVDASDEVVWQLGATPDPGLSGEVHDYMGFDDFLGALLAADVFVSHAGTGSIVTALEQGIVPVIVPRRASRGEHVDDHQAITARELELRGLAEVREVEFLDREAFEAAAGHRVVRDGSKRFALASDEMEIDGAAVGPLRTPAEWRRRLARRLALADAAIIVSAALVSSLFRRSLGDQLGEFVNEVPIVLTAIPLWVTALAAAGAYRSEYLSSAGDMFRRFTLGVTFGVFSLAFASFLLEFRVSRAFVLVLFLLTFFGGAVLRFGVRQYLRSQFARGRLRQRVLIAGTDSDARQVAEALGSIAGAPYEVVGYLDDTLGSGTEVTDGIAVVGEVADALEHAYSHRVGLVVVSPGGVAAGTMRGLIEALEGSPVDLAVAPSLFDVVSRRVAIENVGNTALLHVDQVRLARGKAVVKRLMDLVVAAGLLAVLFPLGLLATVAIRLDSPGPVLFRQLRVGKEGAPFTIYKFRTMVRDAEDRLQDVQHLNEVGQGFFKVRHDPRVTRVGRFLRKWSIDEVPQLWNVLRGDMSMVGPRPPLPNEVAGYETWHRRRLRVRPGITGVWQTSGRSTVPFEEAVRMDVFYIENWSVGTDLVLLAKTVWVVLGRGGAY